MSNSRLKRNEKIGEGSFGVVYSGTYKGETVAIKEVKANSPEAFDDFRAEASKMKALVPHANVVGIVGICDEVGAPLAIVTEYCEGGSLDVLLYDKTNEITDEQYATIVVGCARGLAHLHAQRVIHRDIASRNVLLADRQTMTPKLTDFGMAREKSEETYYATTKTMIGPIRWMAPEQMEKQQYSTHSDCFSFGVLLYECYAREQPWLGSSNIQVGRLVLQ